MYELPRKMPENATHNYFLIPEDQLPDDMKFTIINKVIIAVYSFLLLASLMVNSVFLAILIRRRHRTRTHYLMINLCLSNFYLVFVDIPLQIAWSATVYWAANDGLCRALQYFSIIGLYGNAFFTVAIALDRWQSISKAVTKTAPNSWAHKLNSQRTSLTIVSSWIMAHICSIPQAIIYHVEEHPALKNYHQCVTFHYFTSRLSGIAYSLCVSCLIYCVPLLALSGCSLAIWLYIRDHASSYVKQVASDCNHQYNSRGRHDKKWGNSHHSPSVSLSFTNRLQDRSMRFRCSTKRLLCRAERQAFRLTVVFLMIFIACHTPFQIISVWHAVNPALSDTLNPIVYRLLFACGVLPTIVDPIAYAKFLIPITNELKVIMSRRRRSSVSRRIRNGMNASPVPNGLVDDIIPDEAELRKMLVPTVADRVTKSQSIGGIANYSPPGARFSVSSSRSLLQIPGSRVLPPER